MINKPDYGELVELDPTGGDFGLGHEMGIEALDLIGKHVDAQAAEHEPIVILGVMTALMQYALQACSEETDVDELVGVAKEIAKHTLEHETRH